jgi:DNA-binding SARP family transcriptional activator
MTFDMRNHPAVVLKLMGEFELSVGSRRLTMSHGVARMLAYLALNDRPVNRTRLACELWPAVGERQAANSLRTTLWRAGRACDCLVRAESDRLQLNSAVRMDVTELSALAGRLIHHPTGDDLAHLPELIRAAELLPDWDDEWVTADRERFRLLRLEALERAASALIERSCLGDALIAALASVQSEPLRESCQRLIVEIHLKSGNLAEALRSYYGYCTLLRDELGLEPSRLMQVLVAPLALQTTM